jgi:hypothetical protein
MMQFMKAGLPIAVPAVIWKLEQPAFNADVSFKSKQSYRIQHALTPKTVSGNINNKNRLRPFGHLRRRAFYYVINRYHSNNNIYEIHK